MRYNDIRMKEAEKRQELQISVICQHCTCTNLMPITKDSVREDYQFRCYWCGKIGQVQSGDDIL